MLDDGHAGIPGTLAVAREPMCKFYRIPAVAISDGSGGLRNVRDRFHCISSVMASSGVMLLIDERIVRFRSSSGNRHSIPSEDGNDGVDL